MAARHWAYGQVPGHLNLHGKQRRAHLFPHELSHLLNVILQKVLCLKSSQCLSLFFFPMFLFSKKAHFGGVMGCILYYMSFFFIFFLSFFLPGEATCEQNYYPFIITFQVCGKEKSKFKNVETVLMYTHISH